MSEWPATKWDALTRREYDTVHYIERSPGGASLQACALALIFAACVESQRPTCHACGLWHHRETPCGQVSGEWQTFAFDTPDEVAASTERLSRVMFSREAKIGRRPIYGLDGKVWGYSTPAGCVEYDGTPIKPDDDAKVQIDAAIKRWRERVARWPWSRDGEG